MKKKERDILTEEIVTSLLEAVFPHLADSLQKMCGPKGDKQHSGHVGLPVPQGFEGKEAGVVTYTISIAKEFTPASQIEGYEEET